MSKRKPKKVADVDELRKQLVVMLNEYFEQRDRMSRAEFAKAASISRNYLHEVQNEISKPGIEVIERLFALMGAEIRFEIICQQELTSV